MEIQEMNNKIKENKQSKIKLYPCNNLRASNVGHPCERYLYLSIKNWEDKKLHNETTQCIFDLGNKIEEYVIQTLKDAGFEIITPTIRAWKVDKPLITVVIPCYFCSPYIKKAVRSVQNQNFMDIAINIVIDGSDENTLKVLKELTEEDSRIELIFNEKRMGILYSRSIGVLKSKTKYVLTLDQDDLFFDSDVFSYLYVIAEEEDLDMMVFQVFETRNFLNKMSYADNFNNKGKEHNLTIYQPELSCHTLVNKKFGRIM